MPFGVDVRYVNERELLRVLGRIDNDARLQVQRDIVKMAAPLAGRAKSIAPSESPLSGWVHRGRTGWRSKSVVGGYRVRFGGRGFRGSGSVRVFPLLTLEQRNPAGAIFDWAGRKTSGSQFVAALDQAGYRLGYRKGSRYSRVLFPAFVLERRNIVGNIQDALDQVARRVNREMR